MDDQILSQRLAEVEANLTELVLTVRALLWAELREPGVPGADLQAAPAAWIAGELRQMADKAAPDVEVSGYAMPVNSIGWCLTRIICDSWFGPDCQ